MIANIKNTNTQKARLSFIVFQSNFEKEPRCAEIGCWIGENAEQMLSIDPKMELLMVDAYSNVGVTDDLSQGKPEEVKKKAADRVEKFGDRVTFIYEQSEKAYILFPDEYFDYIYIDGDHSYWGAYRDIRLWWPKVKRGGMLAGHDVGMPSVGKAVIDFAVDTGNMLGMNKIEGGGNSDWWIWKP